MTDRINAVESFALKIPRDEPYLGPLEEGNVPNETGCFIRPRNRTVYSIYDHCVLVKVTTESGVVGWGECVAVVTPHTVTTIIEELLGPLLIGRDPHDVVAIYEDHYDAMRVRGFFGGFYHDAIAGIDIALWDIRGKLTDLPVSKLLGAQRADKLPVYVSGLPGATREDRAALGKSWIEKGFSAVKFAAAVSDEGEEAEMAAVREAVGPETEILVDLHWRFTAPQAIALVSKLEPYGVSLIEAPVAPEDIDGLAQVAQSIKASVATGEEYRTVYEYRPRFLARCMDVIQPEMGRTGITSFMKICAMAEGFHCRVMPHASIGIGIYQAASLHASAALTNFAMHEYQHSITDKNSIYIDGDMKCDAGFFYLPEGAGLGVSPNQQALDQVY
jgi:L-alanine-DL-glutamate epimerase-like enolase superfamily enzyme